MGGQHLKNIADHYVVWGLHVERPGKPFFRFRRGKSCVFSAAGADFLIIVEARRAVRGAVTNA